MMKAEKIVLAVLLGLGALVSVQCQNGVEPLSLEKNKRVVQRQVDEAWNRGNVSVLDDLMAPNLVNHRVMPGVAPDREGFKQIVTLHRKAFSDLRVTIEDIVAEGDKVANRWTWSGTHDGEYMGVAPTGKRITQTGISIHRFEGGKIVEQWHEMNTLGVLQQLGAVPARGGKK